MIQKQAQVDDERRLLTSNSAEGGGMFSVKHVADRLNISPGTVYKAVHSGELECHRFGAAIRISAEQLQDYLEKTRVAMESNPLHGSTVFKHL